MGRNVSPCVCLRGMIYRQNNDLQCFKLFSSTRNFLYFLLYLENPNHPLKYGSQLLCIMIPQDFILHCISVTLLIQVYISLLPMCKCCLIKGLSQVFLCVSLLYCLVISDTLQTHEAFHLVQNIICHIKKFLLFSVEIGKPLNCLLKRVKDYVYKYMVI